MQQKTIRAVKASSYGERGFTLIEVIIAMFILAVVLLSLISVTVTVIKGNTLSKEMTTATTLARDKLEATKSQAYGNIAASTESFDSTGLAAGAFYTRVVNIDTSVANMKTVTVTVSWNWGILPRSVILSTSIAS